MTARRILIADDHPLVREGIKARIESVPDWTVCAEAVDGREAVALAVKHRPDVAVLDIGMPVLNGLAAAREIRKACPETEVLMLTMLAADDLVSKALEAGARGFILKTDAARLLVTAIEALLQHKPFFTGVVSEVVLAGFLQPKESADARRRGAAHLTARETQILQLLAEANSSKEVAALLGVSTKTVEAHRANLMRKLDLHSIAELVRYAMRHHIIQP